MAPAFRSTLTALAWPLMHASRSAVTPRRPRSRHLRFRLGAASSSARSVVRAASTSFRRSDGTCASRSCSAACPLPAADTAASPPDSPPSASRSHPVSPCAPPPPRGGGWCLRCLRRVDQPAVVELHLQCGLARRECGSSVEELYDSAWLVRSLVPDEQLVGSRARIAKHAVAHREAQSHRAGVGDVKQRVHPTQELNALVVPFAPRLDESSVGPPRRLVEAFASSSSLMMRGR